jgi:glycosyltransferase involved in cell wall biosynthesis
MLKRIIFTVTNDLVYDQRMKRICTSVANAGYDVVLVGRTFKKAPQLLHATYTQKRIACWFGKSVFFYIEYNIRLFFYLLFQKCDCICAIDLDTILPVLFVSKIKQTKRVYDAHELFCEMEEIARRPKVYKVWKAIEKYAVPQFKNGYTIGTLYALEFKKMYQVDYKIVRNATIYSEKKINTTAKYLLYQGAVNEGRSFETLIPAMQYVDATLIICGSGNFFESTKLLIEKYNVQEKVVLKGFIEPEKLKEYTANAYAGITLFTNTGRSNYLSLANRFFDYMHYGVPQICVPYPEYELINNEFEIALFVNDTTEKSIAATLNKIIGNEALHQQLSANAIACSKKYNWQNEEKTLIQFYKNILG